MNTLSLKSDKGTYISETVIKVSWTDPINYNAGNISFLGSLLSAKVLIIAI